MQHLFYRQKPTRKHLFCRQRPTSQHLFHRQKPTRQHLFCRQKPTSQHLFPGQKPTSQHLFHRQKPTRQYLFYRQKPTSQHLFPGQKPTWQHLFHRQTPTNLSGFVRCSAVAATLYLSNSSNMRIFPLESMTHAPMMIWLVSLCSSRLAYVDLWSAIFVIWQWQKTKSCHLTVTKDKELSSDSDKRQGIVIWQWQKIRNYHLTVTKTIMDGHLTGWPGGHQFVSLNYTRWFSSSMSVFNRES